MTDIVTRQPWPELPESMTEWPSVAVEFLVALNRIRRSNGEADTNEHAARTVRHARTWWSVSTAHQWPERGKRAQALEAGIEPALRSLRRLGARLRRGVGGATICTPAAVPRENLQVALKALGLEAAQVVVGPDEVAA